MHRNKLLRKDAATPLTDREFLDVTAKSSAIDIIKFHGGDENYEEQPGDEQAFQDFGIDVVIKLTEVFESHLLPLAELVYNQGHVTGREIWNMFGPPRKNAKSGMWVLP